AEQEGRAEMRLTDLSEQMLLRPPSVTSMVIRLEQAGLVRRRGSLTDHRAKQIGLTDRGRDVVTRVLSDQEAQVDVLLSGLSPAEVGEFQRLLSRLRKHLEVLLARGG